jgi:amino acid transporter
MFVFVPYLWPGADQALALILILPGLLVHSLMLALLGWSMPRSGGDYVWTSRILHPSIGMSINFTWIVYGCLLMGSFGNYMCSYAVESTLVSIGVVTNNVGLINWASAVFTNPFWIVVVATAMFAYVAVILIVGVSFYLKHQIIYWIIGMIGTVVAIALFLTTTPSQYAVAYDNALGRYMSYQGVIDSAKSFGFTWAPSIGATLGAVAFAWLINSGYQFTMYFSGEIKQVRRSMLMGGVGNNIFCIFFYALFAWAFVRGVGDNWLHSLTYLAYGQPSSFKIPVIPNPYFLASVLTNNLAIALIVDLGLLAWGPVIFGSVWLSQTRSVLAMGFDRLLPTALADVSDKYHTPVKSIIFIVAITWLGMIASLYYGIIFANLNYTLCCTIAYAIGAISAAVFPFRKKSMYNNSPIAKYKVGRVPLITILGVLVFFFFIWLTYAAGLNPAVGGPTTPYALTILALAFVGAGALYYIFRAYHKARHGIDIAFNFAEIPPE